MEKWCLLANIETANLVQLYLLRKNYHSFYCHANGTKSCSSFLKQINLVITNFQFVVTNY